MGAAMTMRGTLESKLGDYAHAREDFTEAFSERERVFGTQHPLTAEARVGIASADFALGVHGDAVREALEAEQTGRDHLRFTIRYLPERQALAYADKRPRGLDPLPSDSSRYVLKTWAAVTDGIRWGYGSGGAILVPDAVTREVLAGRELGDVVDEVAGATVRGTRGAWGILTRDLVGRQDSFTVAILAALAPFYNPALYQL